MTTQVQTILNVLYAGERLKIPFASPTERETFRKRLYAEKAKQDAALVSLLGESKRVLCFNRTYAGLEGAVAIMWISKEVKVVKKFEFEILPTEENKDADK